MSGVRRSVCHRAQPVKVKPRERGASDLDRPALDDAEKRLTTVNQTESNMKIITWEITKIIKVANQLQRTGQTTASTSERIAAAFVLNNMALLPESYSDAVEAWQRLDDWQEHVTQIKQHYTHFIEAR